MTQPFDFDNALKALQEGQVLTAELDSHLVNDVEANRRNGSTKKTIKTPTGSFELATPRDRNGSFKPQLVKKHQTTLSNAIESVHRQFRKLTKTKGAFSNENSLLKLLYLGLINAQEKWTMLVHN